MLETVNDARSGKGSFSYKDHATRRSVVSPDETLRINYRDHMLPPFAGSEPVDRAETLSTKSTARLEAIRWFAHVHDSSGCHMSSEKPTRFSSTKRCKEDRIMELKVENSRLQRLVAELLLKNQRLREANLSSQSDCGKIDQNRSRQRTESS